MNNQLAYDTFGKELIARIQEKLGEDRTLTVRKFVKNNNVELDGLVLDEAQAPSPMFYLQHLFEEYASGVPLEDIVEFLYPHYSREYSDDYFGFERLDDFETLKDKIAFKLINRKANQKMLETMPYFTYLDLAIVFYCRIEDADGRMGSFTVNNELLKTWQVGKEELYDLAIKNTKRLFGIEIKDIQEVIVDLVLNSDHIIQGPVPDWLREEMIKDIREQVVKYPIYVLTNRPGHFGAVCMLYKEIENFAEQIDDDLYIVPSSVHEVLLIPASEEISDAELLDILHEVNRDELDETDYLSDQIYRFDRSTRHISY